MNDADIHALLDVILRLAVELRIHVLIGVLKRTEDDMLKCVKETLEWLVERVGAATADEALDRTSVVGFTVCPPTGVGLSQSEILAALCHVLDRDVPVALYQLPQVTQNEMSAETVLELAKRYPNFILFKDTSGADRVARTRMELGGVFLVRGAEGEYARWTDPETGVYAGLLLSTANVFAAQLDAVLRLVQDGQTAAAASIAERIETVVRHMFSLVDGVAVRNPFTNANKILDHVMAFGSDVEHHDPPLLYSGLRLPARLVAAAVELLDASDLLPSSGYYN